MTECWAMNPSARLTALRVKKTMCRLDADISGPVATSAHAAAAALKGKYFTITKHSIFYIFRLNFRKIYENMAPLLSGCYPFWSTGRLQPLKLIAIFFKV